MDSYRWLAKRMKAMGHPIRLRILETLKAEGESCVCHLEARLGRRQAYISQQLARLRDAGLVLDRRDGLNVYYALADQSVASLLHELRKTMPLEVTVPRRVEAVECLCPKCAERLARVGASGLEEGAQQSLRGAHR